MAEVSRLELAKQQIQFSRRYTRSLIDDLDDTEWFAVPDGAATHIAWQVGHLAMAQYMLTLFRLRGKLETDEALIPKSFLKRFVKGSLPKSAAETALPPTEIRRTFDRVYDQLMEEWQGFADADLDAEVVEPYVGFSNRFGSLLFCSHHEMLHAGQIGLIRRLLGKKPIR